MKIALLAKASSPHTQKLASFLEKEGNEVFVLSFVPGKISGVEVVDLQPPELPFKAGYFFVINKIKKMLEEWSPDFLHAHYASSYGLVGALSGFHPLVTTVWGSDVFEFPKKSLLHKMVLKYALNNADVLVSTSRFMAEELSKYVPQQEVEVIPFGVDTSLFTPRKKRTVFTIGCTKAFEKIYGHETLIRAFKIVSNKLRDAEIFLIGDGSQRNYLSGLVANLGLEKKVKFLGHLSPDKLAKTLGTLNILVVPSLRESFGVAALEGSSCEVPIVAADIPGLKETVVENINGIYFNPGDHADLAEKILYLQRNKKVSADIGYKGRKFVLSNYEQEKSNQKLLNLYKSLEKS